MAYDDRGWEWEDPTGQAPGEFDYSSGDPGGDMSAGSGDALFIWLPELNPVFNANVAQAGLSMTSAQAAPTPTGTPSDVDKQSKTLRDLIKWEDPRVQAAALTVGAGALGGLGAGYMTGKKQDEANKIAQQQVDINRQLAESQRALNESKTKQDFTNFKFQQPRGLIDGAQKPFRPAPQIDVTKRWRTA